MEMSLLLTGRDSVRRGKLPGKPRNSWQRFMKVSSFTTILLPAMEVRQ